MTKSEERMEVLKNAGVSTTGFYNVNMNIPVGAELRVIVNGIEVPLSQINQNGNLEVRNGQVFDKVSKARIGFVKDYAKEEEKYLDQIKASINYNGYVKNTKLWRRWVTAQTFRMLNWESYDHKEKGFDACLKQFDYYYQFKMLKDELHAQTKIWKSGDREAFEERNQFFNKEVVESLLNHYLYQLKKYVRANTKQKKNGEEFVILHKYGKVDIKDIQKRVYRPIEAGIMSLRFANNPKGLEDRFNYFLSLYYNKLPYNTVKCSEWKDAYKGSGAYFTLKNMIMFHQVILDGCDGMLDSLQKLNNLAKEYHSEPWRLHLYLKQVVKDTGFDLARSIELHKDCEN